MKSSIFASLLIGRKLLMCVMEKTSKLEDNKLYTYRPMHVSTPDLSPRVPLDQLKEEHLSASVPNPSLLRMSETFESHSFSTSSSLDTNSFYKVANEIYSDLKGEIEISRRHSTLVPMIRESPDLDEKVLQTQIELKSQIDNSPKEESHQIQESEKETIEQPLSSIDTNQSTSGLTLSEINSSESSHQAQQNIKDSTISNDSNITNQSIEFSSNPNEIADNSKDASKIADQVYQSSEKAWELPNGQKDMKEIIDDWLSQIFDLRILGTNLYIDDLDDKLSSLVYLREQLSQRLPIRIVLEEPTAKVIPESNIENSDFIVLRERCYNVMTVERKFEIFISHIEGIDLKLLRSGYGEDWNLVLTPGDTLILQNRINNTLKEFKNTLETSNKKSDEGRPNRYSGIDTNTQSAPRSRTHEEQGTVSATRVVTMNLSGNEAIKRGLLGSLILEEAVPLDDVTLPEMWLEIRFLLADIDIAPPLRTRKSTTPKWNQWLRSNVSLKNFPRETRIYATLYGMAPTGKEVGLAWAVWSLFNWNGYLPCGSFSEQLRRSGRINPLISTAAPPDDHPISIIAKMPLSPSPVGFPEQEMYSSAGLRERSVSSADPDQLISEKDRAYLKSILNEDPLSILSKKKKEVVWELREYILITQPKHLPKVMLSANWANPTHVQEAHRLLKHWPVLSPQDALELLESSFPDTYVRTFAVKCLEFLSDQELLQYLPQLVQVLKYENYHYGPLSIFLLQRALNNRLVIGHSLFWYLYAESHHPEIKTRYALMLEAYLLHAGEHGEVLSNQVNLVKALLGISRTIAEQMSINPGKKKEILASELSKLCKLLPPEFSLPIDSSVKLKGIRIENCKVMDSNALPLWIEFENVERVETYPVLFKSGDDLRQDILTLQMFGIMDGLWKSEGLDLGMTIYKVVATGANCGMIQIVKNSTTTAKIQKDYGGATKAFSKRPLKSWIIEMNSTETAIAEAIDSFTRSCAGYCVATYVIGIGDRHNDNIMVTQSGHLFHIDFGHFLGNIMKFGLYNRESAPFVLTPEFVHVMGDETGKDYQKFLELSTKAYMIVRANARIFLNLFHMMLSTGIPQLKSISDIQYLKNSFSLSLSDEEAIKNWEFLVTESLNTKTTQFNFFIHNLAHPD